jgi:SAM-dependent methyltransferase
MPTPAPIRSSPFDALAAEYDRTFTRSLIGRAQRDAVWVAAARVFRSPGRLLEVNCGTGVDAVFLAKLGYRVLALDGSSAMVALARQRIVEEHLQNEVTVGCWPIENLDQLPESRPYDAAFSNFGGLNCVSDLEKFGRDLAKRLKPGSPVLLCLLNRYCLSEIVHHVFRLQFGKAFRRLRPGGLLTSLGNGTRLRVYYPSVHSLVKALHPCFRYRAHQAIGLCVPPSYLEDWVTHHRQALAMAKQFDEAASRWPLLRDAGDHYLVHLERL